MSAKGGRNIKHRWREEVKHSRLQALFPFLLIGFSWFSKRGVGGSCLCYIFMYVMCICIFYLYFQVTKVIFKKIKVVNNPGVYKVEKKKKGRSSHPHPNCIHFGIYLPGISFCTLKHISVYTYTYALKQWKNTHVFRNLLFPLRASWTSPPSQHLQIFIFLLNNCKVFCKCAFISLVPYK